MEQQLQKILIVSERRDFLKQLYDYLAKDGGFLVQVVVFSFDAPERYDRVRPDMIVIDTDILTPVHVLLDRLRMSHWEAPVLIVAGRAPEAAIASTVTLRKSQISERLFLDTIHTLLNTSAAEYNGETVVVSDWEGHTVFIPYPDVYSIMLVLCAGDSRFAPDLPDTIISTLAPVDSAEFIASDMLLCFLSRSHIPAGRSLAEYARQIMEKAGGKDCVIIYYANVPWREVKNANLRLQNYAHYGYFIAGEACEAQMLERRRAPVPQSVLIESFASAASAVFEGDENAVARNVRILYLQALKQSLDMYSVGFVRELVTILNRVCVNLTGVARDDPKFGCFRAIEAEARFVTDLLLETGKQVKQADLPRIVTLAIIYVFMNFRRDISLDDAARETDVSRSYLSRVFHACTNTTFLNFLSAVRVRIAEYMLRESSMRIADISEQVGYEDAHYFSRLFRKTTGMSPVQYRNAETDTEESP
jgi:AraC-like DNA-binding protein